MLGSGEARRALVALGVNVFVAIATLGAASPAGAAEDDSAAYAKEENYPSAAECGVCHSQIYKEWASSSHAYASISPMFHKFEQAINDLTSGTIGSFCVRCHQQIGTQRGEPREAPPWERSQVALEGVTCITCHRVSEAFGRVNGERRVIPGPIFNPVYGSLEDSVFDQVLQRKDELKLATREDERGRPIHGAVVKLDQISRSEFCASCHQVAVNLGIKLEVVWEQYRDSPANAKGVTCQDCHMGRVPGRAEGYDRAPTAMVGGVPINPGRRHSNHAFYGPGYSIAHPGVFPHNRDAGRWTMQEWLTFDYRAGWGTPAFEDGVAATVGALDAIAAALDAVAKTGLAEAVERLAASAEDAERARAAVAAVKVALIGAPAKEKPAAADGDRTTGDDGELLDGAPAAPKGPAAVALGERVAVALANLRKADGARPRQPRVADALGVLTEAAVAWRGGVERVRALLPEAERTAASGDARTLAAVAAAMAKTIADARAVRERLAGALAVARAAWGVDFPATWVALDDRLSARAIVDANIAALAEKRELRRQVMENGSRIDGPFFASSRRVGQDLAFTYVVTNTDEGHNLPSGSLGAQPELWLNVALIGPDGSNLWESGYVDANGDMADLHSLEVAQGRIAHDDQLFNLQTRFLTTNVKGTDREMYLPVNFDVDQLPFLRPAAVPTTVLNHPPFVRMEGRSLPPLGSREANYTVPSRLIVKPGTYKLAVRLRSRAEPIYFMRFVKATRDMEQAMNEWMLDIRPYTVEFEVR